MRGDEILRACVKRYHEARTLILTGTLRDRRNSVSRSRRIFLVMQRPDHCRIEVDNNVTVIVGRGVWSYRGDDDRFAESRTAASVPALAATENACEGVRLLSVDLFLRGEMALGRPRAEFRHSGYGFAGGRPCYQFARASPDGKDVVRAWIDQDEFTVRRWRIEPAGGDEDVRDEACPIDMQVDDVQFDRPVNAAVFRISRPGPARATR